VDISNLNKVLLFWSAFGRNCPIMGTHDQHDKALLKSYISTVEQSVKQTFEKVNRKTSVQIDKTSLQIIKRYLKSCKQIIEQTFEHIVVHIMSVSRVVTRGNVCVVFSF